MCDNNKKITIIGTGIYGIALGKRFLLFGFEVLYGSRNPNKSYLRECFGKLADETRYDVTKIGDAWEKSSSIVFVAVNAKESIYRDIVDKIVEKIVKQKKNSSDETRSKIVIEISNHSDDEDLSIIKISNAQILEDIFLNKLSQSNIFDYKIRLVKGFNLIDAYSLSSFIDTTGEKNFYDKADLVSTNLIVPLCGNCTHAKSAVIDLCHRIGLRAYDFGKLDGPSLKLEFTNRKTFESWYSPSMLSLAFLAFNFTWIFINYYLFPKKPHTFKEYLERFSLLSHLNKVLGYTALQQLAFVYLASVFASVYQLKYGTKYHHFPKYLDYWLKTRKQFGLWAFMFACAHLIATMFVVNPNYLKEWYRSASYMLTINSEISLIAGLVSFLLMLLVALTSINSIGASLNWCEWRFAQTHLGISCLAVGVLHTLSMYFRIYLESFEVGYTLTYILTRAKLIAALFPILVLFLRYLFGYWRPLSDRVQKIRNGEFNNSKSKIN